MKEKISLLIASILVLLNVSYAQLSYFDSGYCSESEAEKSLELVLSSQPESLQNTDDIIEIYFSEINIGKYLRGLPENNFVELLKSWNIKDSVLIGCAEYVNNNLSRFRYLNDFFKGEENFWEPNYYWLEYIEKNFPDSSNINIIAFDLDFKELVRSYSFTYGESCKSCEEYFNVDILIDEQYYEDSFTDEEFENYITICQQRREKFSNEKNKILKKYGWAEFTDQLQEVDSNCVILYVHPD